MIKQITNSILMIRPVQFRMNEQTAVNNYYQKTIEHLTPDAVNSLAVEEFDAFVQKLQAAGIQVVVVEDTKEFDTPDSIFPNNWISFHKNGTIALYPMFAENRRFERKESVVEAVEEKGFSIKHVVDYTEAEQENLFWKGQEVLFWIESTKRHIVHFPLEQMNNFLLNFVKILISFLLFFLRIKQ